jgi:ABC-type branched-subunit amino acid transport system ATPase component/ABC-type branched-subunit amino acid transport system permease subunit
MTVALQVGTTELFVGLTQGLAYALLGLGLVLIYRATRVVHFGYGEVGAFGALVLAKLVLDVGWSWWVALPLVVVMGAVIGAAWELIVVRRLSGASRLVLLVATIGIAQLMFAAQLLVPDIEHVGLYPTGFDLHQPIGDFILRGDHVAVLVVAPLVAAALAWFLNRTLLGLAVKAAAENTDAASLAGVKVKLLSTVVWAIGGALATLTFVLLFPVRGVSFGGETPVLGPGLLLRALVVGLAGRLVSLPLTVVGGVVFGVTEAVLFSNVDAREVELYLFIGLAVLLAVRGAATAGADAAAIAGRVREVPARLAGLPWVRRLPRLATGLGLAVAVVVPLIETNPARQFTFAKVLLYVLMALSVTVITGWAGQLSLCQFAFVGVGAFSTAGLTDRGMSFLWAAAYAVVIATGVATVVGFPALRLRGLFLAVVTLGFAQAAGNWLFAHDLFKAAGTERVIVRRADLGPFDLTSQRTYYYVCLVVVVVVAFLLSRLRRSGVGRAIIAVRENEAAAAASTLSPASLKLLAFAISGAVAGLAGALLGGLFVELRPGDFGPQQSILVLTMAVIGGVGAVSGAVLGALYVIGIPNVFGAGNLATLLVTGVGLMTLVLFLPGGLLELVHRIRDALLGRFVPGDDEPVVEADADVAVPPAAARLGELSVGPRTVEAAPGAPALACQGVEVRFGGLVANRNVDLTVGPGELVGLIGTNGAGKSTLMNAVGGYVRTSVGTIQIFGQDVTGWPAHDRAQLGVGRVFQDARLFGELTVRECVMVALEARSRTEFVPTLLGLPPAVHDERVKRAVAADLVDLTGLGRYADTFVAELSTGTRRIAELACLIAGGSRLLLLDEPTGGVAQREVEAFGAVIQDVRRQLDASILLIEHDMPLVMSLSDRVVCMTAGSVIAEGAPDVVRNDPAVIAAYLGTDARAIERSDLLTGGRRRG